MNIFNVKINGFPKNVILIVFDQYYNIFFQTLINIDL